jgi:hypothetical protein
MRKEALILICGSTMLALCGCARNEPGTMGGGNAPETVATGAPKNTANATTNTNPHQSSIESEHASSSFDDSASTNSRSTVAPNASTKTLETQ